MRATAPLFNVDAGWSYVVAGLALFAAGVLIPAHDDLRALRHQLERLRQEETLAYSRLKAYTDFTTALDEHDPVLVRRLAAAQLNMIPQGQLPVLQAASFNDPVKMWVESSIETTPLESGAPRRVSSLARWASGPSRLWLFAAAAMSVFVGLMLGPTTPTRRPTNSAGPQPNRQDEFSIIASTAKVNRPVLVSTQDDEGDLQLDSDEFADASPESTSGVDLDSRDVEQREFDACVDDGVLLVQSGIRDDFDVPERNDARPPGTATFPTVESNVENDATMFHHGLDQAAAADVDDQRHMHDAENSVDARTCLIEVSPRPDWDPVEVMESLDSIRRTVTQRDRTAD